MMNQIHLKSIITILLISFFGMMSCAQKNADAKSETKEETKPNIIYILADDMGYGDVGAYGQTKIKTPNIDKLAGEGIRFTDHYAGQTVCSPSRCALMTGMHMGNASVRRNGQLMNPDDVTVAELVKTAGYKTGIIGKWGLSEGAKAPNSPNQQGFDHYFGFQNQGFAHFYYPEYLLRNHDKVDYPENLSIRDENGYYIKGKGTYSHDEFAKEALGFIKDNKSEPFFLYLPFAIPHAELTVPEDSKEQYKDLNWPETTKPERGGGKKNDAGYGSQYSGGYCATDDPNMTYAAMISRMDENIGRIMELLEELNIAENTIIMFASDNGPSDEGGQSIPFFDSSAGLRGKKRDVYEGGIRIPFVVRWKGKVKAGTESNFPSAFWDFLPTVCELTGVEAPKNIDGISLLPTLLGETKKQESHNYLYWQWQSRKGLFYETVRVNEWKFYKITPKDKKEKPYYELYNLDTDVSETKNIVSDHPELQKKFIPYLKEAGSDHNNILRK